MICGIEESAGGTSTVTSSCAGTGVWSFSGTLGVATDDNANGVLFGLNLMGDVNQNGVDGGLACTAYNLSAYSGFSITMSSVSGAVSSIALAIGVAGVMETAATVAVPTTATPVHVTWAQLGIDATAASRITFIGAQFVNGAEPTTVDLVIKSIGLF